MEGYRRRIGYNGRGKAYWGLFTPEGDLLAFIQPVPRPDEPVAILLMAADMQNVMVVDMIRRTRG